MLTHALSQKGGVGGWGWAMKLFSTFGNIFEYGISIELLKHGENMPLEDKILQ